MSPFSSECALVTGAGGLVGSAAVKALVEAGYYVIGVDNDMRKRFFGEQASTVALVEKLGREYSDAFQNMAVDIRDPAAVRLLELHHPKLIVHAAAQPAHDYAAVNADADFGVNLVGTQNLLEGARWHVPDSTFIYCSTSKVYGDNPNRLPLVEERTRLDLRPTHPYYDGIDETLSIDQCLHSLFGATKAGADLLVQEYGRYFGMPTVCFRPGCISGANHQGVPLHGFLSYLMRCAMSGEPYTVIGYDGLQVRCNIHAEDLVAAFLAFHSAPIAGAVYNIGGGREHGACSMVEAIGACERISGRALQLSYDSTPRIGDHRWWISSNRSFQERYPTWSPTWSVESVLNEIYRENEQWLSPSP